MQKTGWKTHCFGRLLVDLPAAATINGKYEMRGAAIEKAPAIAQGNAAGYIDGRERELRAQKHATKGSMFLRRADFPGGSAMLLSWDQPGQEYTWKHDTYLVSGNNVFMRSGLVSPSLADRADEQEGGLARGFSARGNEVPSGTGFCIDGGFIAGNEYWPESFQVHVKLPAHPGASLIISSTTQNQVEPSLLDRTGGIGAVLAARPGIGTLRKGKTRDTAIDGEEYLVAGSDDGQRLYTFAWEVPGKAESVAEPNITVELMVLKQNRVGEDNPYRPAFTDDEQALELWDGVVRSVRMRPGSI